MGSPGSKSDSPLASLVYFGKVLSLWGQDPLGSPRDAAVARGATRQAKAAATWALGTDPGRPARVPLRQKNIRLFTFLYFAAPSLSCSTWHLLVAGRILKSTQPA